MEELIKNLNEIKAEIIALVNAFIEVAKEWGISIPTGEKLSNIPSYFTPDYKVSAYTMPEEFKKFKTIVANSYVYNQLKQSDNTDYDWTTKCLNTIGIYYGDLGSNITLTSVPSSYQGITTPSGFINLATATISSSNPLTVNAEWCIFHIVKNKKSSTTDGVTTYYSVNANGYDLYNLPRTNAQYIAVKGDFDVRGGHYSHYNSISYTQCKYLQAFSVTGNYIESTATDSNSVATFQTCSVLFIEGGGGFRPSACSQAYNLRSYPCLSGMKVDNELIVSLQYAGIIDFDKWDWSTYTGETGFTQVYMALCKADGVMNLAKSPLTVTELSLFTSTYPQNLDVKINLPDVNVKIFNNLNVYKIPSANTWVYLADNAPTVEGKTLTTSTTNKILMQRAYSKLQPSKTVYEVFIEKGWIIA